MNELSVPVCAGCPLAGQYHRGLSATYYEPGEPGGWDCNFTGEYIDESDFPVECSVRDAYEQGWEDGYHEGRGERVFSIAQHDDYIDAALASAEAMERY